MTDFPAAHSMDTTWFAIDADGCIGIFDSEQGGAVPENLSAVTNNIDTQKYLLKMLASSNSLLINRDNIDVEFILEKMSLETLLSAIESIEYCNKSFGHVNYKLNELFLLVSNIDVIHEIQKQAKELFNDIVIELGREDDCLLIYTSRCEIPWLKKAIESGRVLAGSELICLYENLNLLGWYVYNCDSNYPTPYSADRLPKKPLYFQNLPPEIVQNLRLTRFANLRFSEVNTIQPLEHMPCSTWWTPEQKWQGTDGEWYDLPD